MIGKLKRVPLREVWQHEAHDFTTWLEENIVVLNDALGLNLDDVKREQAAGKFSVDLVAEDLDYGTVVVENQLERSDHDHLGKLITYLAAFEAKAAIWIVSEPRPEHVAAVAWLNEADLASFYLVKMEAVMINNSPPAPLLTLITGPSEETKAIGRTKKELSERHYARREFWTQLLEKANEVTQLHAGMSPAIGSGLFASAGRSGMQYAYRITTNGARVAFYLNDKDPVVNREHFSELENNKAAIEDAFGGPLNWDARDGRLRCNIESDVSKLGYSSDREQWPEIQEAMIEAMVRLEKAMRPYVEKLDQVGEERIS